VPDSAWKLKKYKQAWTVADGLNASIGQGYVLANPFQLAVMAARIGSGLKLKPRLVIRGKEPPAPPLSATPEQLAIVRDAMFGVINQGGTGGRARLLVPGVTMAGKTGTAQVRRITMAERAGGVLKNGQLPFKMRDHALLVCFAPAEKPKYALAVVLEHNGHITANLDTPLTGRDIMTYMFDRDRAMKSLEEFEPTWGGDISTRAAAQANAFRAAASAPPPVAAAATETNATQPTAAPAVEAATDAANATAEALARDAATGNGAAQITGSPEPQ
jgi:penicillin-binding protein 2